MRTNQIWTLKAHCLRYAALVGSTLQSLRSAEFASSTPPTPKHPRKLVRVDALLAQCAEEGEPRILDPPHASFSMACIDHRFDIALGTPDCMGATLGLGSAPARETIDKRLESVREANR